LLLDIKAQTEVSIEST